MYRRSQCTFGHAGCTNRFTNVWYGLEASTSCAAVLPSLNENSCRENFCYCEEEAFTI